MSSDQVVRELYLRDDVRAAVAERFGPEVLDADGQVDRAQIAARVFSDPAQREWLEGLLLPLVEQRFQAWREQQLRRGQPAAGARGADPVRGRRARIATT